jgi:hypothetical protein
MLVSPPVEPFTSYSQINYGNNNLFDTMELLMKDFFKFVSMAYAIGLKLLTKEGSWYV